MHGKVGLVLHIVLVALAPVGRPVGPSCHHSGYHSGSSEQSSSRSINAQSRCPRVVLAEFGGFNLNDPSHLIAGAGGLAAGAFAFKNIAEGNDNIRARPTFGLAFNPHTNQVVPQVGAAVQVRAFTCETVAKQGQ